MNYYDMYYAYSHICDRMNSWFKQLVLTEYCAKKL